MERNGITVRVRGIIRSHFIFVFCQFLFQKPEKELPILKTKGKKGSNCSRRCQTNRASVLPAKGTNSEGSIKTCKSKPPAKESEQVTKWRQLSSGVFQFTLFWCRSFFVFLFHSSNQYQSKIIIINCLISLLVDGKNDRMHSILPWMIVSLALIWIIFERYSIKNKSVRKVLQREQFDL